MRSAANEFKKDNPALKCANCGSVEDINIHHVVPLSMGGNDIITNLIPLCGKCHTLIHHGKCGEIDHSFAVKRGLEKARAENKHLGRRKTTSEDIPENIRLQAPIYLEEKMTLVQMAQIFNISRPTLNKYLKLLNLK